MPVITVLTPVHAAALPHLRETAESVLSQELPPGWELEWVVQGDGAEPDRIRTDLPDDARIKWEANEGNLGAAATRNLALGRSSGRYIQNLDADDLLLPGALTTILNALEQHPRAHWAYAQADDLMPDGTRVAFDPWLTPTGLIPAGRLSGWIEENGGNVPVPCAAVAYRTTTLRALGGWMALPIGEDVGLLAAASAVTDGWQCPETTWLYRQHPGQISRSEAQPHWSRLARQAALQRISALRLTETTITGTQDETEHMPNVADPMKGPVDIPTHEDT